MKSSAISRKKEGDFICRFLRGTRYGSCNVRRRVDFLSSTLHTQDVPFYCTYMLVTLFAFSPPCQIRRFQCRNKKRLRDSFSEPTSQPTYLLTRSTLFGLTGCLKYYCPLLCKFSYFLWCCITPCDKWQGKCVICGQAWIIFHIPLWEGERAELKKRKVESKRGKKKTECTFSPGKKKHNPRFVFVLWAGLDCKAKLQGAGTFKGPLTKKSKVYELLWDPVGLSRKSPLL